MNMSADDQRGYLSMSRQQGQYALLMDENFDIIWHTETLTSVLGYDDVRGRNGIEFVHPDDLELALETMALFNDGDELFNYLEPNYAPAAVDVRLLHVSGEWRMFEACLYNHLEDPDVRGVLCICRLVRDRTDIARSVELLGTGASVETVLPVVARLADRSVGVSTRVAIAWRDGERVRIATAPDEHVMAPELADAAKLVWTLGLTAPLMFDDLTDPRLDGVGAIAAREGFRAGYLVPIEAPSGEEIIGALVAWGITTTDFQMGFQAPIHIAIRLAALAIADSRTKRDLRWAASHDPLTGLFNRAEFGRRIDAAAENDIVLLYIDLDDFKPINDNFGHGVGDAVLVEASHRIAAVLGQADFVGRLGGDEFAVVCAGTKDAVYGRMVADRIVTAIREPIVVGGVALRVGASVGVAVGAQPLIPSQLMQRADEALYTAKSSGKNTVCLAG